MTAESYRVTRNSDYFKSKYVETKLLKPIANVIIPARTKPFNMAAFYQTRSGLYVYDTFADHLDLNTRQTVDVTPERPYVALCLKAGAYDGDIRKALPEWHLSMLEDIASLIVAQPGGQPGFLRNNGQPNPFYVAGKNDQVFLMNICWLSGYREWRIFDRLFDGYGDFRFTDDQVFCPGTAVL